MKRIVTLFSFTCLAVGGGFVAHEAQLVPTATAANAETRIPGLTGNTGTVVDGSQLATQIRNFLDKGTAGPDLGGFRIAENKGIRVADASNAGQKYGDVIITPAAETKGDLLPMPEGDEANADGILPPEDGEAPPEEDALLGGR